MSNRYCSKFKQKLEEMKGKLAEITPKYFEDLLSKYKATGDKNIEEKLDKINKILQEIEEFKKEYEEKDGLKELKCSNNQLTSLPELPNGLKVFWGMKNPLSSSSETIKRIKSHPNYDPHYWLL